MDAYSSYIKQLSDIRVGELRREAADYRLSQLARPAGGRWWRGENRRFRRPAWTKERGRRRQALELPWKGVRASGTSPS